MTSYELYTIIFSAVVALSAIVTCVLTVSLIMETKRLRYAQAEPEIIPYFKLGDVDITLFYLIVENLGPGVAYNVKFEILKDFNVEKEPKLKLEKCGIIANGIKYFPPRMKHEYFMATLVYNGKDIKKEKIELRIHYDDVFGNKKGRAFDLNVSEFDGKSKITPPDSELGQIGYQLQSISKALEKLKQSEEKDSK